MRLVDLDKLIAAIESTDWYHINSKGEFVQGARNGEEALYKHDDIFKAIENLPKVIVAHINNYPLKEVNADDT